MILSIVVPVYNEAACLPALLEHLRGLLNEERAGLQLVVVDGGSDDGSSEILAAAGIGALAAPRGRARQMNAGATAARGEVLLFLHADTRIDGAALDRARRAIQDGAVGGFFAVRLDSAHPLLRLTGRLITWRSRLSRVASGDQAIFVSREVFEAVGGFAELPLFEDLDLCRRLKREGRFVPVEANVVTSARRWRRDGILRTIVRMWVLRILYYCGVSPLRLARYYSETR